MCLNKVYSFNTDVQAIYYWYSGQSSSISRHI